MATSSNCYGVGGDFAVCLLGVLDEVAGLAANLLPKSAAKSDSHDL